MLVHYLFSITLCRIESGVSVLVCSRGGGGLLEARMEFVAELWQANIRVYTYCHYNLYFPLFVKKKKETWYVRIINIYLSYRLRLYLIQTQA